MRKTPFYDKHLSYHAKMVEFADYIMPIRYRSIIEEHRRVRSTVGVFDVSHMGEFVIQGEGATAFLQRMTINDISKLSVYQAQYSAMCYNDGGIVDDLLIYRFPDHYMLVVNAANIQKDYNWLSESAGGSATVKDISDSTALLAVQGPKSMDVLQPVADVDLEALPFYHFCEGKISGCETVLSRTGYTGERGYEIYHNPRYSSKIWEAVMESGQPFDIEPVGLGARDTLRMEMKYALYGNDIDQSTNPLEAGLGWITKLDKGDFVGKEAIVRLKENGLQRHLVCIRLLDKGIPRPGYTLYSKGDVVGKITSGTLSPTLNVGIGLGYVKHGEHRSGTTLEIDIRGKRHEAKIVKPPFVKSRVV